MNSETRNTHTHTERERENIITIMIRKSNFNEFSFFPPPHSKHRTEKHKTYILSRIFHYFHDDNDVVVVVVDCYYYYYYVYQDNKLNRKS